MLVDVELHEADFTAVALDDLLEQRRQLLAGPAPRGPEVDDHGNAARRLDDVLHEACGGRILDELGVVHASRRTLQHAQFHLRLLAAAGAKSLAHKPREYQSRERRSDATGV